MDHVVIMAGGAGTRLWPLSRVGRPKQLLPVVGGRSLLQVAFERALSVVEPSAVYVCAARRHQDLILEQLPGLSPDNLLAEPAGRDSMAAVTWSVAAIARRDAGAVVGILTADHVITPLGAFAAAFSTGLAAAGEHTLVTFGVRPTSPHTGYGYLHVGEVAGPGGTVAVRRFAEKPSADLARTYLAAGDWWWNSGMFAFRAATFLAVARTLAPDITAPIDEAVADPARLDAVYPQVRRTSVDYAVMEPVSQGRVPGVGIVAVPLEAQWADIGGYAALADLMRTEAPAEGGSVIARDVTGGLVLNRSTTGRLLVVAGVEDLIVVEDDDVTLVVPMSQAESIKHLAEAAREKGERYV